MVKTQKHCGFTAIEFVTTISIIFLLIAILLPAIRKAREAARSSQCKNNLKQIALSLHNYHDANQTFPPGYVSIMGVQEQRLNNEWGWGAFLLPYLDQSPLFLQINFETSVNVPMSNPDNPMSSGIAFRTPNASIITNRINPYLCSIDSALVESNEYESLLKSRPYAPSSYSAITGIEWTDLPCATVVNSLKNEQLTLTEKPCSPNDGAFYLNSRTRIKDIRDGCSQTLLIGEAGIRLPRRPVIKLPFQNQKKDVQDWRLNWAGVASPLDQEQVLTATIEGVNRTSTDGAFKGLQSSHTGGAHAALADGSVQFLSENIDSRSEAPYGILQRLSTIHVNDMLNDF